jgi:hypothetical protein
MHDSIMHERDKPTHASFRRRRSTAADSSSLQVQTIEPLAFSLVGAVTATGNSIGRSRLFELIKSGEIDARKVGKHTIVMAYSLREYLLRQPRIGAEDLPPQPSPQSAAA